MRACATSCELFSAMYVKTGECSIQGAIMVTQSARDTVQAKIPRLENSDVSPFLPTPWTKCPMSQPSAAKQSSCHAGSHSHQWLPQCLVQSAISIITGCLAKGHPAVLVWKCAVPNEKAGHCLCVRGGMQGTQQAKAHDAPV